MENKQTTDTLEQKTQEQAVDAVDKKEVKTEEQPEYWIDENGEFHWKEAEEEAKQIEEQEKAALQQEQKTEQSQEDETKQETQETQEQEEFTAPEGEFYTKEEIEKIGIDKLDPKKIPPELVPFYKSMQADYTRKTQKVAEERKQLEKMKQEIQEQIKLVELQSSFMLPKEEVKAALERATEVAKKELGEQFDEYDPYVQNYVNAIANNLLEARKAQIQAEEKLKRVEEYLKANDPNYEQVEQMAMYLLENELPLKEVKRIDIARQTGDPLPLLDLYERAREELQKRGMLQQTQQPQNQQQTQGGGSNINPPVTNQQQTGQGFMPNVQENTAQAQAKRNINPPVVESAGTGTEPPKKRMSAKDLAGKPADEQARILIEMGLV